MLPNKTIMCAKVKPKFSNKQKIALSIVTIVDLMSFCSISFMSLFLPQDEANAGETFSIFNFSLKCSILTTIFTALIFGLTLPKFGVKNVFLVAVIFSRIATFLFGTLHYVKNEEIFIFLSYFLRAVETMGETGYVIAGYVIIFSTFPEEVGIIRGLVEAMVGIGSTIGPPVGELILSTGGYGFPFYFVGILVITLAVAGNQVLENPKDIDKNYQSFTDFLKVPAVIITSAAVTVTSITTSAQDLTLRDHMAAILPDIKTGELFLLIAATFALSSPFWGYLSEKMPNYEWMIPIGLYLSAISMLFVDPNVLINSLQFPMYARIAVMGFLGVAMSLALVPTFQYLTMSAMERGFKYTLTTHTYVISSWTFWFAVGQMLGPNISNLLYKQNNFTSTAFVIAGLNVCVGFAFTIFLYCKSRNRSVFCTFSFSIYLQ